MNFSYVVEVIQLMEKLSLHKIGPELENDKIWLIKKIINFSWNFTRLAPGIFSDLLSLEILWLHENELIELDIDLFKKLICEDKAQLADFLVIMKQNVFL